MQQDRIYFFLSKFFLLKLKGRIKKKIELHEIILNSTDIRHDVFLPAQPTHGTPGDSGGFVGKHQSRSDRMEKIKSAKEFYKMLQIPEILRLMKICSIFFFIR